MRKFLQLVALAAGCFSVQLASGHGIPMSVNADANLQLFSERLVSFDEEESALEPFPGGAPVILQGTAGFYPVFGGGIPAGTVLTVDASGSAQHPAALLFWDGTSILPSPTTITVSRSTFSVDLAPDDVFAAGGPLGAYNGQEGGHSSVTLSLPLDAPTGLYAIGFQISSPGFESSETFWGVANNGVAPEDLEAGLAAIHAAVPEPSSVALGLLGLTALAGSRRVRRMTVSR